MFGVDGVVGETSLKYPVGEAVSVEIFRDGDAGEIGEKLGDFGVVVLLPSKLNQSKLNFSLNGLTGATGPSVSAMTTSPSRSVFGEADLKSDSTIGMV